MADDEEDWFEQALREDDDGESDEGGREDTVADEADGDEAAVDETDNGERDAGADDSESTDADDVGSDSPDEQPADDVESPFGDLDDGSFGAAGAADGAVDANPFAGDDTDDAANPFAGVDDPDGDLFDQDFASAFESAGDHGFGGGGSSGANHGFDDGDFDDEEFDSDIPRIDLGIEGLDSMIQGGVPERSLMVVMGSAGTGKTTFGLQFLNEALEAGENAVFITLEETRSRIVSSAEDKGWDVSGYVDDGRLAVIDIDPIEMANSLTAIRNELPYLVEEFDASRLVLDSVSLLEMMYDDQATRRSEIYDFTKSLKQAGVTTMLTSEASEDNPFVSRYGIIEYLVDAVFVLRYVRPEDFRETRLAVEIQKIRDANHSRETKPYEITSAGISVYRQANIF